MVLISSSVTTNWTIMAPSTYIDWTGTNHFQMQTGVYVTNSTALMPWHGHTIEILLEESRGPVVGEKRLIPLGNNTNEVQLMKFSAPSLPPAPKAPSPLPLGIRNRQ
jgi:hypothetical protein